MTEKTNVNEQGYAAACAAFIKRKSGTEGLSNQAAMEQAQKLGFPKIDKWKSKVTLISMQKGREIDAGKESGRN